MSDRRREWRYNRDDHMTDEELARERAVAEENAAAMVVRPLVFNEDDLPPIASEHDQEAAKW